MIDELGNRMKHNYENATKTYLVRRMPVIIRLDGKSFHTFTKGFNKPFDDVLANTMKKTMKYLCKNIEGCVFGYTQSDEISLLLVDYKNLNTEPWFNYSVQKCVSVAASMATMAFNKYFPQIIREQFGEFFEDIYSDEDEKYLDALDKAMERGAMFDARVFNIPKEEVVNYFIWRQNDCYRNCINTVAQCMFDSSEIYHKSTEALKELVGDRYEYEDCNLLGTCMLKEASQSTPTAVFVEGIQNRLGAERWVFRIFNFKECRGTNARTNC
jgi:tRNA(His) 5'-end guanylyltransferase